MSRKRQIRRRWWVRWSIRLAAFGTGLMALFLITVNLGFWGPVPSRSELEDIRLDQASEVYTADSVLIGKFFLHDRQPVPLASLPLHTRQALIAIEDARFYSHDGIDYPALGRVFLKNIVLRDDGAGGGSTISQQLIKNLYPRSGGGGIRLVADKVREMIAARRLERIYEKDSILEWYLNTVSFGGNRFGIEAAARTFFDTPASDLSVTQSATLVGMLKATYTYDPVRFPERSLERRNLILRRMADLGYLPQDQLEGFLEEPLEISYRPFQHHSGLAPYFREEVRRQVGIWMDTQKEAHPDLNLYTSGLKIYTTLHAGMQRHAEAALHTHMKSLQSEFEKAYGSNPPWKRSKQLREALLKESATYRKLVGTGLSAERALDSLKGEREVRLWDWNGEQTRRISKADSILHYAKLLQAGSLVLDPGDGAVRVWVGGINFQHFQYDHVSQSRRQVGSTFKPIVYAAALENGQDPCRHIEAREVRYANYDGWTPSNSGDTEETFMNYSMEEALRHSINTVSVKVLEATGIPRVIATARAMGIESDLPEQPSIALGSAEIRMTEMAGAYAAFLGEGRPVTPYMITGIADSQGHLLYAGTPNPQESPALSSQTRELMLEMLQTVPTDGTAARLRSQYGLRGDLAGKTGTTQENKDAWFIALTPKWIHVSWVGLESHRLGFPNTRIGQGAHAALPLFGLWYQRLSADPELRSLAGGTFPEPSAATRAMLDCPPTRRDGFFKRIFTNPNKTKTRKFRDTSNP